MRCAQSATVPCRRSCGQYSGARFVFNTCMSRRSQALCVLYCPVSVLKLFATVSHQVCSEVDRLTCVAALSIQLSINVYFDYEQCFASLRANCQASFLQKQSSFCRTSCESFSPLHVGGNARDLVFRQVDLLSMMNSIFERWLQSFSCRARALSCPESLFQHVCIRVHVRDPWKVRKQSFFHCFLHIRTEVETHVESARVHSCPCERLL